MLPNATFGTALSTARGCCCLPDEQAAPLAPHLGQRPAQLGLEEVDLNLAEWAGGVTRLSHPIFLAPQRRSGHIR